MHFYLEILRPLLKGHDQKLNEISHLKNYMSIALVKWKCKPQMHYLRISAISLCLRPVRDLAAKNFFESPLFSI